MKTNAPSVILLSVGGAILCGILVFLFYLIATALFGTLKMSGGMLSDSFRGRCPTRPALGRMPPEDRLAFRDLTVTLFGGVCFLLASYITLDGVFRLYTLAFFLGTYFLCKKVLRRPLGSVFFGISYLFLLLTYLFCRVVGLLAVPLRSFFSEYRDMLMTERKRKKAHVRIEKVKNRVHYVQEEIPKIKAENKVKEIK